MSQQFIGALGWTVEGFSMSRHSTVAIMIFSNVLENGKQRQNCCPRRRLDKFGQPLNFSKLATVCFLPGDDRLTLFVFVKSLTYEMMELTVWTLPIQNCCITKTAFCCLISTMEPSGF